jgi:hypothetical protein
MPIVTPDEPYARPPPAVDEDLRADLFGDNWKRSGDSASCESCGDAFKGRSRVSETIPNVHHSVHLEDSLAV